MQKKHNYKELCGTMTGWKPSLLPCVGRHEMMRRRYHQPFPHWYLSKSKRCIIVNTTMVNQPAPAATTCSSLPIKELAATVCPATAPEKGRDFPGGKCWDLISTKWNELDTGDKPWEDIAIPAKKKSKSWHQMNHRYCESQGPGLLPLWKSAAFFVEVA